MEVNPPHEDDLSQPFDTLKAMKNLEESGFERNQSEALVNEISDVIHSQLVTKKHFDLTMAHFDIRFKEIDMKFQEMEMRFQEMEMRFQELETRMEMKFKEVDNRFEMLEAKMENGFRDLEQRMTIKLGGMLVVMTGVFAALVKLF